MDGEEVFTRSIDMQGQIEIPAKLCEVMGWEPGTKLELGLVDISIKSIVLREVFTRCSLCRSKSEHLAEIEAGYICLRCASQIK